MQITKNYLDDLTYKIIGAAIEVHKHVGPGLLESVYHKCLEKELQLKGLNFKSEHYVELNYKGLDVGTHLRCDFLVEDAVVVELKSVNTLVPIFDAQLFTYMKLLGKAKGVLINFNVTNIFREGQKTLVNEIYRNLPEE